MGTNYYLVKNGPTRSEPIHIGKSSCGWLFNFQDQDTEYHDIQITWHTYEQVKDTLKTYASKKSSPLVIIDEYNRLVSYKEFMDLVDSKQKDPFNLSNPDNFEYTKNVNGYRFSSTEFS